MIRSFTNTIGSSISAYIGYIVPVLLNSHAAWLNITVGGILLWVYQHYFAPSISANGLIGALGKGFKV